MATLLTGNVIVGFSPAGSAGKTAGAAAPSGEAAASPLGFFGALLDFAAAPSAETGIATATKAIAPTVKAVATPAPVFPPVGFSAAVDAAVVVDPVTPAPIADVPAPDADDVMADLVDALAALGDALDAGTSPDPALEDKVTDLIDSLAGLLGLPVPSQAPAVDPAIVAAASVPSPEAGAALDPLAAINAAATTAPPATAAADTTLDVAPGAILPSASAGVAIDASLATKAASPVTVGFAAETEGAAQASIPAAVAVVANAAPLPEAAKQVLAALGLFTKAEAPAAAPAAGAPAVAASGAASAAPAAASLATQIAAAFTAPKTTAPVAAGATVQAAAAPTTATTEAPAATGTAMATEVPEVVKQLAVKLTEMAEAVKPQSPQLAERLTALATKLASGEIDSPTLEKLGITPTADAGATGDVPETEVDLAIQRLLMPAAETRAVVAPKPFVGAELALPAAITPAAITPAATEKAAEPLDGVRTATRPAPEADPEATIEAKPEAKADPVVADTKPAPERRSFAAVFPTNAAVAADQPATPAPQQSAALPAPTTPVVATEARALHAAYKAPVQQINIPQVAFEVVRQVQAGNSRFQIRLDPPELGRIDVKLDVDKAGNVNARMTVERAETLDLMQRDQRTLERALAQAGLDSNKTNLEFSLRQNPFARDEQQSGQQQGGNGRFAGYAPQGEAADEPAPVSNILAYRSLASAGGVNLFV